MRRLKDVEHARETGELKQRISSLEVKLGKIEPAWKLAESGIEPEDASEYQGGVTKLHSGKALGLKRRIRNCKISRRTIASHRDRSHEKPDHHPK